MSTTQMRPMGVGEILDAAIKITTRNIGTLLKTVLAVLVPLTLIQVIVSASTTPDDANSELPGVQVGPGESTAALIGGQVVAGILGFILYALAVAACYKAVSDAYLGDRPDWRESLRYATGRLGPLMWVYLLGLLAFLLILTPVALVFVSPAFGLLVLAIIPLAIWLGVSWVCAVPIVLNEDVRGVAALRRSRALVQGRFWPTLGVLVVAVVIVFVAALVIGLILGIVTAATSSDASSFAAIVANALVNLIANALTLPFTAAVVTLVYFDLRARKEGYDLELAAGGGRPAGDGLAAPPAGQGAASAPAADPPPAAGSAPPAPSG